MEKSAFEQMGGTYYQQGDYFLPNLSVPENAPVGIWGRQRLHYLKKHRQAIYTAMLLSGKLNSYLDEIDQQAEHMLSQIVKQIAEQEGITEHLKSADQMEWIRQMNNVRERAMEVINCQFDEAHRDYVYTQAWVDFLAERLSDPAELEKVRNFR